MAALRSDSWNRAWRYCRASPCEAPLPGPPLACGKGRGKCGFIASFNVRVDHPSLSQREGEGWGGVHFAAESIKPAPHSQQWLPCGVVLGIGHGVIVARCRVKHPSPALPLPTAKGGGSAALPQTSTLAYTAPSLSQREGEGWGGVHFAAEPINSAPHSQQWLPCGVVLGIGHGAIVARCRVKPPPRPSPCLRQREGEMRLCC